LTTHSERSDLIGLIGARIDENPGNEFQPVTAISFVSGKEPPMIGLRRAFETMRQAMRTGSIGVPVAARLTAHLAGDQGLVERLAARLLAAACDWIADAPLRVTTIGESRAGSLSVLAMLTRGGSVLVSASTAGSSPLLEALVFGQHGIVSWEGDAADVWQSENEEPLTEPEQRCWQLVQTAVTAHKPLTAADAPGAWWHEARMLDRQRIPKPPFGVLLVSGHHTHQPNYALALKADRRCRLIAVTDEPDVSPRRRELNERLANDLDVPYHGDVYAAVKRDDVAIVSICAEPERRGRIIVAAANAGKVLYLDKPLAGSVADADAIVRAVQTQRLFTHMFSLVPGDLAARARDVLESNRLGQIIGLHIDLTFAKGHAGSAQLGQPRRESPVPTTFEWPDAKRELTNIGVYGVVFVLSLLRRSVRRVVATTGNYFFAEHQQRDFEDFGQMLLELDGGVTASITCGRTGWQSSPAGGLQRMTLVGTQGAKTLDANRPRVETWSDATPWSPPERNPDDPLAMWFLPPQSPFVPQPKTCWTTPSFNGQSDATYFLDRLEAGEPSDVPAGLAAVATKVLFAAYQSAASGEVVHL
jgi:predicted dehydrogenase